jgi:hypothetical protein
MSTTCTVAGANSAITAQSGTESAASTRETSKDRGNAPARTRAGPSSTAPLQSAAQTSDDALTLASSAHDALPSVQRRSGDQRGSSQDDFARAQAEQADDTAKAAVRAELDLAEQTLSPAHAERYLQDLRAAHGDSVHAQRLIDEAASASAPGGGAGKGSAPPAPTPVTQALAAALQAETQYLSLHSQAVPNDTYQRYVIEPKHLEVQARWQTVQAAVEQELSCVNPSQAHPYGADPVAARAGELMRLNDHPRFQQAVAAAVTSVADQRLARAGAASLADAYAQGGIAAAAGALARLTRLFTPSQSAYLVQYAQPTLDQMGAITAFDLGGDKQTKVMIDDLGRAARSGGPDVAQRLGETVAALYGSLDGDALYLSEALQASVASGTGPELAMAAAQALRASSQPELAELADSALVMGIHALPAAYEAAQQQYARRQIDLQLDLMGLKPALSAEEQADFSEAFWSDDTPWFDAEGNALPSNAAARAVIEKATGDVAHTLEVASAWLEQQALAGDAVAAKALLAGYQTLAVSVEHSQQSVEWMTRVGSDQALFAQVEKLAKVGDLNTWMQNNISADGISGMASKLIEQMATAPDQSKAEEYYEQFKKVVGDIGKVQKFAGLGKDIDAVLDHIDTMRSAAKLTTSGQSGSEDKFAKAAKALLEGWESKTPFQKTMTSVGLAIGFIDAGQYFHDGAYFKGILETAGVLKNSVEVSIGVLKVLTDAGKATAEVADFAQRASKVAAKYLPYAGAALSIIDVRTDIRELAKNPNAGEVLGALGSAVSLIGEIPKTFVVAWPIGAALGTVGMVLRDLGEFVDVATEHGAQVGQQRERQHRYLLAAGIDDATATSLFDAKSTIGLLSHFDLNEQQIRSLAADLGADDARSHTGHYMLLVAATLGLQGAEVESLVRQALAAPDPQAVNQSIVDGFFGDIEFTDGHAALAAIAHAGPDPSLQAHEEHALDQSIEEMRQNQLAWLQAQFPDAYDELEQSGHVRSPGELNYEYFFEYYRRPTPAGDPAGSPGP